MSKEGLDLFKFFLFLHIIAALFWVGGMLFLTLVIAPFLMTLEPPKRSEIYQVVGKKFRFWGWVAIVMLLITGPINLSYLGVTASMLFDPAFHASPYGKAVMTKIALVILIVLSSLLHDFWLGPGARTNRKYSFYAMLFGRGNLIIALLIVIFAVIMRSGGW